MSNNPTIQPAALDAMHDMLASAGYSDRAITYYLEKPNMGKLANADQVSEVTGQCGDTMRVYLRIADGVIQDAKFEVMGCPGAVASAMAVADMVKGASLAKARSIRDVISFAAWWEFQIRNRTVSGWRPRPCNGPWRTTSLETARKRKGGDRCRFSTISVPTAVKLPKS